MANYIYNDQLLSRTEISQSNRGNLDIFAFGNVIFNDNVLFNEPYWRSVGTGSTYFDIQPYLHIREGQVVGNDVEYADLGRFVVTNITNNGYERGTATIHARDSVFTLEGRRKPYPIQYKNNFYYYTDFNDQEDKKDFTYVGEELWGISDSNLIFGTTTYYMGFLDHMPLDFVATLNQTEGLEEYVISTKLKFESDFYGDYCGTGIYHRIHNTYSESEWPADLGGALVVYPSSPYSGSGSSYCSIGDTGRTLSIAPGSWVYLTVVIRKNKIKGYYSFDNETFTLCRDAVVATTSAASHFGAVGLGSYEDEAAHKITYGFLEVRELAPEYSKGEVLENIVTTDEYSLFRPIQNIGLSDFYGVSTSGFTYELGITNNKLQVNIGSSVVDEYYGRFQTNGATFTDFMATFNFKWSGVSGSADFKIGFGTTSAYYGLVWGQSSNSEFYGVNYEAMGSRIMNGMFNFNKDVWYKGKVTKEDTKLSFYVNDELARQTSGLSLGVLKEPGNIIFMTGGLAKLNYKLSIRDFKIDQLSNVYDTIQMDSGTNTGDDIERFFPYGYRLNTLGASMELIQLGQSMRAFGSGDLIRTAHTNNLNRYMKFLYAKGDNVAVTYSNPSDKISLNGLLSDNAKTYDSSIVSKAALENYGKYDLRREMRDSDIYNLVTLHRPNWNLFDNVTCSDSVTGITGTYYVDTLLKRYDVMGEYLQYTTIKRNVI